MAKESFCEAEERRFEKLKNFGLPNSFKKIGISIAVITFLFMIFSKIFDLEVPAALKFFAKRFILVGLLIVAIAREKIEDEMIRTIRGQAFSMAFVTGIIYTLIQPLINFIVNIIMSDNENPLKDIGDFQILSFMLMMYLAFFYMIKRKL